MLKVKIIYSHVSEFFDGHSAVSLSFKAYYSR